MNSLILRLTVPNIVTNLTVPLLGMVDLAIVGHLGGAKYIGAVAIGAAIFNFIYWNFGFLRMGTSGFTAQAYGGRNFGECANILIRGLCVAWFISLVILVFNSSVGTYALLLLNGSGEIAELALIYFKIRVWAAPATLSLYVFKGWFIGMQNSRTPMYISIISNIINIIGSYYLAIVCRMGISGVAIGTLIAQYISLGLSVAIWAIYYRRFWAHIAWLQILRWSLMWRFFKVNGNIFLRTVCLVAVSTYFVSASALGGEMVLAVNTLLMQLFTLFSYFMDGFAYSAEALVGRFIGSGSRVMLVKSIRYIMAWGVGVALLFAALYGIGLEFVLGFFTNDSSVIEAAVAYRWWIVAVPLVGFVAFLYDGILIGATSTALMRNVMFIATTIFFVAYSYLNDVIGQQALWLAFILYLLLRGILQIVIYNYRNKISLIFNR